MTAEVSSGSQQEDKGNYELLAQLESMKYPQGESKARQEASS